MEQIRAFIAIELPDDLKSALTRLQEQLKLESKAPVKWVDPYSIHLTLKFLGNVSVGMTGRIVAVMEDVVKDIPPFRLQAGGTGGFPNLQRVQIVWVGVSGELDRLGQLQRRIDSGLNSLGFTSESRPFTPHLTMARLRDHATPDERQKLGQLIASTSFEKAYGIEVDRVHLIRSQLTRQGAVYSQISSVRLK